MSQDHFIVHDDRFHAILGPNPTIQLLLEKKDYPFAHEAGVFIPSTNDLFITSNQYPHTTTGQKTIQISRINLDNDITHEEIFPANTPIPMANGGVNYKGKDNTILICGQGSHYHASGLYEMSTSPPYTANLLIGDFHGRPFNSVNDVVVHSDGSIWFTDPTYAYEQGIRGKPVLPSQVYRFDPKTRGIRAVADGFGKPNGICFSPDEKTVYITDTDRFLGNGSIDDSRVSSIYAFDITTYHNEPFLTNRRLFAFTDSGIPDGIKCDLEGNVYSGCGDGVHVWTPGGVLLGRIRAEGGVANFCFGREGEMFLLNEHRLWRVQLGSARGALLGI